MFKTQLLRMHITERLSAVAEEIYEAFENTIAEYEEKVHESNLEIERQRKLLQIFVTPPVIKLHRTGSPAKLTNCLMVQGSTSLNKEDPKELEVSDYKEELPPEQQHCEQERSPSLDQEDPELPQIKEEQEELWISQEGEKLQDLKKEDSDTKDSMLSSPVSGDCFQNMFLQHYQSQRVDNREGDPVATTSTEPDGEGCGGPEPTSDCLPPSSDCSAAEDEDRESPFSLHVPSRGSMDEERRGATVGAFRCSVCGKTFSRKCNMLRHMTIHTSERPHKCSICLKEFKLKSTLKSHLRTHTGDKPFGCSICGKRFSNTGSRHKHIRTHYEEKAFRCNVCGKEFSKKYNMLHHVAAHTSERKKHKCSFCLEEFRLMSTLKTHLRTHTGEKPYSCSVCGKSFSKKTYVYSHMRIHTGVKPFKCTDCGKAFSLKKTLLSHARIHTDEKPHSCNICSKEFRYRGNLKVHMRVHTGVKPFVCSVCGKEFSQSGTLKKHLSTHTETLAICEPKEEEQQV